MMKTSKVKKALNQKLLDKLDKIIKDCDVASTKKKIEVIMQPNIKQTA